MNYKTPIAKFADIKTEFSEMTSLTKESICRVLKELKSEGIINHKGNNIEILNMKLLENISLKG